jgi:hypothetical protein
VATPRAASLPFLYSVAAVASDDVWAVGSDFDGGDLEALVEHWDGARWEIVPTPPLVGLSSLFAVDAVAPDDVWAVGVRRDPIGFFVAPLAEHWNGREWSVVDVPSPDTVNNSLVAVSARTTDDVWAVGRYFSCGAAHALVEHWDGSVWSVVSAPDPASGDASLSGVEALGADDAWAVGAAGNSPLVQHWDGTAWSSVEGPKAPGGKIELAAVSAVSAGDAWAVGTYSTPGAVANAVAHWDGFAWSLVAPLTGRSELRGVDVLPEGGGFAVGARDAGALAGRLSETTVDDSGFAPASTAVGAGRYAVWHVGGSARHGIADTSGLRLFDSGLRAPGGSFAQRFDAAGTYPVGDPATGHVGQVRVPMSVHPDGAKIALGWASGPPPVGLLYDVQVRRPGRPYQSLRFGTTATATNFVPDGGPGTYSFRARLRGAGAAAGWSPVGAVTVP